MISKVDYTITADDGSLGTLPDFTFPTFPQIDPFWLAVSPLEPGATSVSVIAPTGTYFKSGLGDEAVTFVPKDGTATVTVIPGRTGVVRAISLF